ncbi:MAG: TetR/AcrR family transcriptional regulator [Acidimicrobiia bacterium]
MPKVVDHEQRRGEVAEAVLRLVARKGVGAVTLNDVALESGWSRGVLTHYFDNKDALLEASLRHGMRTIAANLAAAADGPEVRRALAQVLEEVLPLDERRLAFSRVYVGFMAEAIVSEHLQGYFGFNHAAWRDTIAALVRRGVQQGHIDAAVEPHPAADALAALTEGLRMRALFDAELTPPRQRAVLDRWLAALLPAPSPGGAP